MCKIVRYVHKSHISELFIIGNGKSFYIAAKAVAVFRSLINNLLTVVQHKDHLTIGDSFSSFEEAYDYLAKEFPNHIPKKVMVNRIVRTRWVHKNAA